MLERSRQLPLHMGLNSVRFKWTPNEHSGKRCSLPAASPITGPFESIVAEVMTRRSIARKIASFTTSLMPRSSAFTMIWTGITNQQRP